MFAEQPANNRRLIIPARSGSNQLEGGPIGNNSTEESTNMATDAAGMDTRMIQLLQENEALKKTCSDLQQEQESIATLIEEANRKQLKAELNAMELEEIFASVSDPMWSIRDDGVVIRVNTAMLQLLGKPLEQVVGQQCSDLLDYALCHTDSCPLSICNIMTRQELDITMQHHPDHPDYYIITVAPLTTIVGTRAVVVQFKNITARKAAENELADLNRTLSEMAHVDGLTGIANRRYFDETFDKEWRRIAREGNGSISLLLADIDYFKKYNDRYGHQAGDDTLIKVAQALKGAIMRPSDLAARYGGEEFVILLPETALEGARNIGERILEVISDLGIEHHDSEITDHITLSMGAATMSPSKTNAPSELITMADNALYQAKGRGRNNLTLAEG